MINFKKHLPRNMMLIGAFTSGVIGMDAKTNKPTEVEGGFGISLSIGNLGVNSVIQAWDCVKENAPQDPEVTWRTMLVTPTSSIRYLSDILQPLQKAFPTTPIIGGFVGQIAFTIKQSVLRESSMVGLALGERNVQSNEYTAKKTTTTSTFATRGCNPIGPIYRVTSSSKHEIINLEHKDGTKTTPENVLLDLYQLEVTHDGGPLFIAPLDSNGKPQTDIENILYCNFMKDEDDSRVFISCESSQTRKGAEFFFFMFSTFFFLE